MLTAFSIRGLFAGVGYALCLALILVVSRTVQSTTHALVDLPDPDAIQRVAAALWRNAWTTLPAVPCLIVAINTAPRGLLARAAWLSLPILLMALWTAPFSSQDLRDPGWLTAVGERGVTSALFTFVCLYRNRVQGAADILLRQRVDTASLDAALDRARLQLLRSQIEPHFLFNTLANVRTLARMDRTAAAEMLGNLMVYLHAALPKMRQESCTLAEEMQLIDAYLSLHRVRMGARLSYEVSLPSELESVQIPTMMLLTLVENAVKHGIAPSVTGGFMVIGAVQQGSMLVLSVADSGCGMPVGPMQGSGSGLANVRMRLRMQYGAAASIELSRARPRGVVATVSIPMPRVT